METKKITAMGLTITIVGITILFSTENAFAVPINNVAFSNQVTCDSLSVPDKVDEFGKGASSAPPGPFPNDEEITTSDDAPVTVSVCTTVPPSGGPHAVVNITNESPFTFEELWYVADPETSLTNIDGLVSIAPSSPVLATFRIDSMFSSGGCGVNCPLLAETLTTDGIFEPGETWKFQIDDYSNTEGLSASAIDSIGFPSASPPSSGSIIAFDNIISRTAKDQFFFQTANNVQPTTPSDFGFSSFLFTDNPSDFASVVLNGAPGGPEAFHLTDSTWAFFHEELSKAAFDAAFPNIVYTLSTSGGNLGTFNELVDFSVDPERYPNEVPFFTGNSFNDLQGMDPTQDITLTWNLPSSGGPQVTGIGFRVSVDISDDTILDFNTGDTSVTSIVIPGNTLNPNESYFIDLVFQATIEDPLDSFPTGEVSTTFGLVTGVEFSTSSSNQATGQATGSTTILGTCGLSFPDGNSVNYGAIIPNSISSEIGLNVTNSGSVSALLEIRGTDWKDGSNNSIMNVNQTHFNQTSNQNTYAQKALLNSTDGTVTSSFVPSEIIQLFLQLEAILLNPSFTGSATQTMDFTVSC